MNISGWLLEQSKVKLSLFHTGKYYGDWKLPGYTRAEPGFHVVRAGECWLDLLHQQPRIFLEEGDILFFFSNVPFFLASSADTSLDDLPCGTAPRAAERISDATELLSGFIRQESISAQLLFALLPDTVLIRKKGAAGTKIHLLFEVLQQENTQSTGDNNPIISHLMDAILYYIVCETSMQYEIDLNLLKATEDRVLTRLFVDIAAAPGKRWSLDEMASYSFMSRSTFIRRVLKATGYTPNLVLSKLRVYMALNLIKRGCKIEEIYSEIGYESLTGFYRAFKRVMGAAPGAYASQFYNNQ